MILPMTVRLNRGSYPATIPKPMATYLRLDEMLDEKKTTQLITEETDRGVLIRHPTPEERKRFNIK